MKLLPLLALSMLCFGSAARAEDGYDLWLRYRPLDKQALAQYRGIATEIVSPSHSATADVTRDELVRGLTALLARRVHAGGAVRRSGAVLFGTPANSPTIAHLNLPVARLGSEGFVIRSASVNGKRLVVIAGNSDLGALYGAFAFLRLLQMHQPVDRLDIVSAPKVRLRMLDHWDNLDRTIERGFAGFSIFNWWELPEHVDPRIVDYARANASVGINGAVLTNVNADSHILTLLFLHKAAALADTLRPYGIRVYVTARFSAPIEIGGLKTADPLDPAVRSWWQHKADEIYDVIPDFGGFLVKANSEGQPGPQDYGRTHAEGANMLADALAPHGGVVIWRAFVYSNLNAEDRVKQAYDQFVPLDGKFRDNVVVQVKNGPLDFQPREPFSPLFGAMPKTNLGLEVQITKEYLGFELHLVYLGTMWQEVLQSDTFAKGPGTSVARVIDGSAFGNKLTAMAGVSNVGTARNWCGSIFDQANWYAFGRLAWDPDLPADAIANEWVKLTFTADPGFAKPVVAMMMGSREAAVDYMTPLGLAHQMATGYHYGPGPWIGDAGRADWNPVYYNRADAAGIGVERGASGSNAAAQYAPRLAAQLSEAATTPENLLLWFHHVPWTYRMKSGRMLWDELVLHYAQGVANVDRMNADWAKLKPFVDPERFQITADFLRTQAHDARIWRDASIAYFQSLSGLPLPAGVEPPPHPLDWYRALTWPFAPGNPGQTAAPFKNN